jgi:ribosomal protein S18 acetylase RimI-like enzyme
MHDNSGTGVTIREFCDVDEAAVVALWERVFPGEPAWDDGRIAIDRKRNHQRDLFFVAESSGTIVGTAMAGFDGYRGWIYYVAVAPEFRRRSIGTELMRTAEGALAALRCPQLNLLVRHAGIEVAGFYRALGYQVDPKICMSKRL